MLQLNFKKLVLASALASIFLSGCGGGGGDSSPPAAASTVLSGTVAGGAAVIGTVLITDSLGVSKGGTIEANGHYAIDVNGMTGPFVIKAAGTVGNTTVTYYSAATTADVGGTVNVTPFTNMIVSNIAAQMAETYFSNPANVANIATLITPSKLIAAESALQAKLAPVLTALGVSASIDLLRSTFAADHSGMDAVMDMVKVEVNTTTNVVTLKNAISNQTIATDDATLTTDDSTVADNTKIAEITPTAATDLQTIVTKLNSFASLFATKLPTVAELTNSGVFDTSTAFTMGGKTYAQFATELSTDPEVIGLKFSNVAIALDPNGTAGILTAAISSSNGKVGEKINLKMVKIAGVWKIQGDGRIADMQINAQAQRDEWTSFNANGTVQNTGNGSINGLWLNIDPQAYNANNPGATTLATQALVTGPGLPAGGVTMTQDVQNTWLKVDGFQYGNNVIPECGSTVNGQPWSSTAQCVTISQALDNSKYTVVLKNAAGTSLNGSGYELNLPKQPYVTSTLNASLFPSISSVLIDGAAISPTTMVANKSVGVIWTLPSGISAENVNVWANTSTVNNYFRVEKKLLPTATSSLLALGAPVTVGTINNAGVWLSGKDVYGRTLAVSKSLQFQ